MMHAAHQRDVMHLLRKQRQVLADVYARRRSPDRFKLPTEFGGRVGLHVPKVDMRWATFKQIQEIRFSLIEKDEFESMAQHAGFEVVS